MCCENCCQQRAATSVYITMPEKMDDAALLAILRRAMRRGSRD